jgi:hypothetical protein
MQIFVRISTGKTITMDVTNNTLLSDILDYVNSDHQYQNLVLIKVYYDETNLTVEKNKILDLNMSLNSLFKNRIIREIILLAC